MPTKIFVELEMDSSKNTTGAQLLEVNLLLKKALDELVTRPEVLSYQVTQIHEKPKMFCKGEYL